LRVHLAGNMPTAWLASIPRTTTRCLRPCGRSSTRAAAAGGAACWRSRSAGARPALCDAAARQARRGCFTAVCAPALSIAAERNQHVRVTPNLLCIAATCSWQLGEHAVCQSQASPYGYCACFRRRPTARRQACRTLPYECTQSDRRACAQPQLCACNVRLRCCTRRQATRVPRSRSNFNAKRLWLPASLAACALSTPQQHRATSTPRSERDAGGAACWLAPPPSALPLAAWRALRSSSAAPRTPRASCSPTVLTRSQVLTAAAALQGGRNTVVR
jgi:hypothetical protein